MTHASRSSDNRPAGRGDGPAEFPALGWVHRANAEDELLIEVARRVRGQRRRRGAVLAGAAAIVLSAAVWWGPVAPRTGESAPSVAHGAKVALPERRTLPDGSMVELKEGA